MVETANARTAQLKDGLNELLGKMEISGCVSGVASLAFLRLGVDDECDREVCSLPEEDIQNALNPVLNKQLNLALLNHGVQAGSRFVLTATHTEEDIDYTVDAFEKALTEVREMGVI